MSRAKASHCLRRISQGEPRAPLPLRHSECGFGRARHSVRAGLCVRTFGGQRTARPTASIRCIGVSNAPWNCRFLTSFDRNWNKCPYSNGLANCLCHFDPWQGGIPSCFRYKASCRRHISSWKHHIPIWKSHIVIAQSHIVIVQSLIVIAQSSIVIAQSSIVIVQSGSVIVQILIVIGQWSFDIGRCGFAG